MRGLRKKDPQGCVPRFEMLEPRLLLDAIRAPYLQAVTENSIYVLLEANSQTPAAVEYGLTDAYGLQAATESTAQTDTGKWMHNIKLTGLQPDTVYHYRATQGAVTSTDHTFRTAVEPGTSFRFAWISDTQLDPTLHNTIAGRIEGFQPDFVLHGGDPCTYPTWDSWNTEFFVPNEQALISNAPMFWTTGNHEGWDPLTQAFKQAPTAAGEANGYYSFQYGDLHVLVMNTEVSLAPGSPQWTFAQADLAACTSPWKIVMLHRPAYSLYRPNADVNAIAAGVFEPNHVDIVMEGHDHVWKHDVVNGVNYMDMASAGGSNYAPIPGPYTVFSKWTHDFAIIDVQPGHLHLVGYDDQGGVIETLDLYNDSTPPTAPADLHATASGQTQVNLTWTAAQDPQSGVAHYDIYRNGALVGTSTTAGYSDTGLVDDTSYVYTVSAVNGEGVEGPLSGSAAARTAADTTAPLPASVTATSATTVAVVFTEPVSPATAGLARNYTLDHSATVSAAALQADGRTVILTVSPLTRNVSYTLWVTGVTDRAKALNAVPAGTRAVFRYSQPDQLSFQQGVGGYTGTADTMIRGATPTQNFGADAELNVDSDSSGAPSQVLIRFDGLIGPGGIPAGSTIVSATLLCLGSTDVGNGGNVHRMIVPWNAATITWANAFGGNGVQADGVEAAVASDGNLAANSPGVATNFDVTATIQAWANGQANYGWAVLPNGTDGWHLPSAEWATVASRPSLVVTFLPPVPPAPPQATNDSYALNEDEPLTMQPGAGVLGNDTGQSALSAQMVTAPAHGTIALHADGSFTYTPAADYNGTDTFTYRAFDGVLYSDSATVTFHVAPVADAPRVAPQTFAVSENSAVGTVVGTVAATDPDAGARRTFAIVGGNLYNAFTIDAATGKITVRYTPALDYETTPRFDLLVCVTDDTGLSTTAAVTINLLDVLEPLAPRRPPVAR